jgi:hypothetical protein
MALQLLILQLLTLLTPLLRKHTLRVDPNRHPTQIFPHQEVSHPQTLEAIGTIQVRRLSQMFEILRRQERSTSRSMILPTV